MAGYVIANVEVKDAAAHEVLEGDRTPSRVVVLEPSSVEQAKRWYFSEQYRPAKEIRLRAATSTMVIVEGA